MPEYVYRCFNGHEEIIARAMLDDSPVVCLYCGLGMHRRPQTIRVNWNGLKPSAGAPAPAIQQHLQDIDRKRDRYYERHESHERQIRSQEAVQI